LRWNFRAAFSARLARRRAAANLKGESTMANDNVLSKAQAVALLRKLSSDDAFRASYQADPRAALIGLGVAAGGLPPTMAAIATLADKSVFVMALAQVNADLADVHACLVVPTVRISFGK
jgi:putative modified peptide